MVSKGKNNIRARALSPCQFLNGRDRPSPGAESPSDTNKDTRSNSKTEGVKFSCVFKNKSHENRSMFVHIHVCFLKIIKRKG